MTIARVTFDFLRNAKGAMRPASVALVFLVVALASSKTASASCGNYLFRHGNPVAGHWLSHVENLTKRDTLLHQSGSTVFPERAPIRQCSGPNCSNSRIPFAPAPYAPLSQVRSTEPGVLLETMLCCVETQEASGFPESERGARYLPLSVFRPPSQAQRRNG